MMLLLYAIEDTSSAALREHEPQPRGLADEPLSTLTSGDLTAIVSDVERSPEPTPRNFIAYERVIERLMGHATVLPARYGTTAETEHEIKTMLAERRDELAEALTRVQGAVEFVIRIAPTEAPKEDEEPQSGTEYMNRLVDESRRTNELATEAERAAQDLSISTRRTTRSLACLVSRQQAGEFLSRTRARGLTVTGPWPPYSFVSR